MAVTSAEGKLFNPLSLDAVNFLLADVRGALGPYLNVFLVTRQHWSLSEVGLVTTIGGLLGLAGQTPIGAAIDETHQARSDRPGARGAGLWGCDDLCATELLARIDRQLLDCNCR
jgi:hypothetical protein